MANEGRGQEEEREDDGFRNLAAAAAIIQIQTCPIARALVALYDAGLNPNFRSVAGGKRAGGGGEGRRETGRFKTKFRTTPALDGDRADPARHAFAYFPRASSARLGIIPRAACGARALGFRAARR